MSLLCHRPVGLLSALALGTGLLACSSSDGASEPSGQPVPDTPDAAVDAAADAAEEPEEPSIAPVAFEDARFEACVRRALQLPDGTIFPADMERITALECQDSSITSVAGIEHATSLVDLSLWENQISDLAPLAGLKQIVDLQLGLNRIQDLTALQGLTSLRRLGLSVNRISSLAPLAGLTSLEWLNLDDNAVSNGELTHLSGLINLRWLTVEHNGLTDFSAVQALVDSGCEVYGATTLAPRAARLDAAAAAPAGFPDGRLELTTANGKVALRYRLGSRRLAVRVIAPGSLHLRGGSIVLSSAAGEIAVGDAASGAAGLCAGAHADVCSLVIGRKAPDAASLRRGADPDGIVTARLELKNEPRTPKDADAWASSDTTLVDLALATPNQFDAGSCLFMANTGAMEILLNQHVAPETIKNEGDTDLSERFLMVAPNKVPDSQIPYDLTDTLYAYNYLGGSLLNRDYPFCAGYVKETANGSVVPSNAGDPDAYISCMVNWFDQLPSNWRDLLVPTPPAERTVIFVDPLRDDDSQWRVGLFDDDTIERIKHELRTKKAPVLVVYNHYLYWHTNVIVGYDDTLSTGGGCPMVEDSVAYFEQKGFTAYAKKIKDRMAELGGCHDTGVFYVRDSIYDGGLQEGWYDYSTDDVSVQKERYSKRIVKLEYDWAKYLGNHTYTVHRK
jgi:hypothetical protein